MAGGLGRTGDEYHLRCFLEILSMLPDDPRTRKASSPKPIAQCAPVMALSARARALEELDRRFREAMPPPLNERLRLAGRRGNHAVLLAPTAGWATRARAAAPRVLAILRSLGINADSILVKIVPETPAAGDVRASLPPLSAASAQHLRQAAKAMSDPELRDLFLELASFAENDSCS
ncbi:MAG: DUF721 domain-containing protein [Proteobacteria bacterium]|nr:DUF721 domain-containing protein [Pseudomonadota bacterium]